jgi:phosphatidylglycerophosphate synthase
LPAKEENRRPIAARSSGWANYLTSLLVGSAVTPNQISCFSVVFAIIGATCLVSMPDWRGILICALCIQGRLICNLLDGMVAIEGGKKSVLGALYNEFPDRVTDSIFFIALGYVTQYPAIGWACALLAALTAYIRVFGGSLGLEQDFRGPMAKQHRMAVMTIACLLAILEEAVIGTHNALLYAAWLIALGSAITCVTRTKAIAKNLQGNA